MGIACRHPVHVRWVSHPPRRHDRRLCREWTAVSARGRLRQQCLDRNRISLGRRVGATISQPHGGYRHIRCRRGAVRVCRGWGQLYLYRLRPGWYPAESIRRSAGRHWGRSDPSHGGRGQDQISESTPGQRAGGLKWHPHPGGSIHGRGPLR